MNEYEHLVRTLLQTGSRRTRRELKERLPVTRMSYADLDFLVAPARNHTEFTLWRRGRPPEHQATVHLRGLYAGKVMTMVDVGANAGLFSLPLAAAAAPESRFILIEPNPEMVARLRANIALNGLQNITVIECAISDEPGVARLHFSPNQNLGEARLGQPFDEDAGGLDVEVRRLDDVLAEQGVEFVDLLKVDVEGHEDKVILPLLRSDDGDMVERLYFEDSHSDQWAEDVGQELAARGLKEETRFGANALYLRQGKRRQSQPVEPVQFRAARGG